MIPVSEPSLGEEELNNVIEAVKSSWISSKGKFIEEFETGVAKYCGRKYGVATSSGTTALHLALKALGIQKGDEVIVPDLTYVAAANVVTYCNAIPVFVDSHPDYWCMDPEKIEEVITNRTKAIIPVHLYGHPCDMDAVSDAAEDSDLYVVEDAAEAHGTEYKGKKAGSFGDISCFSFFGNKTLSTGEGGMCLTNDYELAEKMRVLKGQGMNPIKRYWHDVVGFNYRMTNIEAAIGVAQLKKLDDFVEKKREIASWYADELKSLADDGLVKLHPEMPWAKCNYWMYSILIWNDFSRDKLIKDLEENGIETRPFFYPMHVLPMYRGDKFPVATKLSEKGINLPSAVTLGKREIRTISSNLKPAVSLGCSIDYNPPYTYPDE